MLEKIKQIQRELGRFFQNAYEDRFSLNDLYKKGQYFEKIIGLDSDSKIPADLRNALEFLDELHDESAREYHTRHKEKIYYHMIRLNSIDRTNLKTKTFFHNGNALIEAENIPENTPYFIVYLDVKGNEIKRDDFDKNGMLKKTTLSRYKNGKVIKQDFYSTTLDYSRERNKLNLLEERDSKGLIRLLED